MEFVRYLLDTPVEEYDSHWYPQYLQCQPCQLNYSYIAKLETLANDRKIISKLTGLTSPPLPHLNNLGGGNEYQEYMKQLSSKELDGLFEKYRMDFEIFGYKR